MTKRILAVEDSATQAESLRSLLAGAGYDVQVATSGEDALANFEERMYDVVISDVVMPGPIDGYALCRRIKAGPGAETPVVLLTSLADPMDIIRGLESGADNFLTKPYHGEHLLERLHVLLDTKTARRQSRMRMGIKVFFMGREFTVTSEREQILDLLMSTFEDAVRQNSELRLRESELESARAELARYAGTLETDLKRFFDLSIDMIGVLGFDGYFRRLNPAWNRILGWTTEELMAQQYLDFIHAEDREQTAAETAGLNAGRQTVGFVNRFRCKDGSYKSLEWRAIPLADEHLAYAIARDVTERIKLEGQFRQAQKMESVGRLAGGVAHDFNNLLSVILGETELALSGLAPDHQLRAGLEEVRNASGSAAGLTRQLLAFSRQEIVQPTVFNLNAVVEETEKMLLRLIGEDINCVVNTAPDAGSVKVDRGQLEQVLINLVVNARDAMPEGGRLTIETANITLDEDYVARRAYAKPGEYVMLAVSDSGSGMTAEVQQHIFEPFFTTKEAGKGSGLGLATCYGIVKQAGGSIEVYSETGIGTTFKVYLPRVSGDVLPIRDEKKSMRQGGTETILLVEDDTAVRKVAKRILEAKGYHILQAGDADEALRILEREEVHVDLLLTDLVLPGMSGRLLAERALAMRPALRVLYSSGYTNDAILRNRLIDHRIVMINKPYTSDALTAMVRDVLDADRDG